MSDARTAAASAALIGQEARDIFAGISSMLQSLGHLRFVGPDWPADSALVRFVCRLMKRASINHI